eukprot:TRINITY_DN6756_c0_g2_i1.p1 TRINITY_DN6756_c0_g2~~TRINITY_DN6756_c0_g2_i1.p1  ORF type:complete len:292 (+),score=53.26 TRINITY_DN6756_c0_g2_i1:507-1382(+)
MCSSSWTSAASMAWWNTRSSGMAITWTAGSHSRTSLRCLSTRFVANHARDLNCAQQYEAEVSLLAIRATKAKRKLEFEQAEHGTRRTRSQLDEDEPEQRPRKITKKAAEKKQKASSKNAAKKVAKSPAAVTRPAKSPARRVPEGLIAVLGLLDKRRRGEQIEYKVQWESEHLPSWEPAHNITADVVAAYEAERGTGRAKQVRNKLKTKTNTCRVKYSEADDLFLKEFVAENAGATVTVIGGRYGIAQEIELTATGNMLWKRGVEPGGGLEGLGALHSWQSLRERYIKYCRP